PKATAPASWKLCKWAPTTISPSRWTCRWRWLAFARCCPKRRCPRPYARARTVTRERREEWLCRVHPDDFPRLQAAVATHCRREIPQLECEQRMHCKDGTYRWMLSRGLAVWNETGDAIRIAGSLTDITAAKVADQLTGLPNRLLFMDRLERRVELSKRHPAREFAILL